MEFGLKIKLIHCTAQDLNTLHLILIKPVIIFIKNIISFQKEGPLRGGSVTNGHIKIGVFPDFFVGGDYTIYNFRCYIFKTLSYISNIKICKPLFGKINQNIPLDFCLR